jgi:outer membrane biosynthesis protein TonB
MTLWKGYSEGPGTVCLEDTTGKPLKAVYRLMGDPRNVAHAKKVTQEKQHKAKAAQKTRAPQPARKPQVEQTKPAATEESAAPKQEAQQSPQPSDSAQSEKSHAVLSKLKELEFHSRGNIENLAELSLTIEEELKQKAFAEAIGAVYAAQDAFQSKIVKLIEDYEAECTRLSGSA